MHVKRQKSRPFNAPTRLHTHGTRAAMLKNFSCKIFTFNFTLHSPTCQQIDSPADSEEDIWQVTAAVRPHFERLSCMLSAAIFSLGRSFTPKEAPKRSSACRSCFTPFFSQHQVKIGTAKEDGAKQVGINHKIQLQAGPHSVATGAGWGQKVHLRPFYRTGTGEYVFSPGLVWSNSFLILITFFYMYLVMTVAYKPIRRIYLFV